MNTKALPRLTRKLAATLWLTAISVAPAQPAVEAWVQRYDNQVDAYDTATKVMMDRAGNVIVAGYTDDAANGQDFLVLKYSGVGMPLWTNRYNGPGNGSDFAHGLALDDSGNVFVTGSSWNGTSDDYATVAYSAAGTAMWTNRYGGPGNSYDWAKALAVDGSGKVIVTGISSSGGDNSYLTIKYSGAGMAIWTNRYDGPGNSDDQALAVAADRNGNVFVTGRSGPLNQSSDFLTVAYSSAGAPIWTNRYDGPGNGDDSASAVAVDASGNVFVTGTANVSGIDYDYVTIKYSGTGVALWTNFYNGPGNAEDQALALAVDGSGNVFVTGRSDSGGGDYDYATVAYSSAGVELWANRYGEPGNDDQANAVAMDHDGNVFVTGKSGPPSQSSDFLTVAYSIAGAPIWTNRYNGPGNGNDFASAVAVDGSGAVFVTGGSDGGSSSSDCTTIKYSAAGISLWTNRYNGPAHGDDRGRALAVDRNGNVIVTGSSQGSGSSYEYATIKYSGAGVPLWTNRYKGPVNRDSEATAVAVDSSGSVVVTGYSDGEYATIKYSGAGVPLWTNRYKGPANDYDSASAVAVDGSGNVFVTGLSYGIGSDADYATIKYSGPGMPMWTNRYNGPGNSADFASAVAVDASGNVVVTGSSPGTSGFDDYATIKYSAAGVLLWTKRYDGPANNTDDARSVAVDGSGNVFVTGESWNGSEYDYATIKYSAAGVALWTNRYNEPDSNFASAYAIAVDSSGNALVTGLAHGGGNLEYVTIKYSGTGLPLWTNRLDAGSGEDGAAIAVDSSGNVFVAGSSFNDSFPTNYYPIDYATVAYSGIGLPLWTNRYNGPKNSWDYAQALAVDSSGNVFVTGYSLGANNDYATIKYSVAALSSVPLSYQIIGNQLVLSWTNAAFGLQSASAVQGFYTNIPGATSPHTNALSGTQRYFRLNGN